MNNIAASQRYQEPQVALLNSPSPSQKEGTPEKAGGGDGDFQAFGSDGFTFSDFLDIINPLQHIPIVSTFYRNATGDTIDPGSQILGGTLFGGPIGAVASIINVAVGESTGMDVGEHALALFSNKPSEAIDTRFAEANALANFETAAGLPKKEAYTAPTGAEAAVLNTERIEAFAETYPEITGAEIGLLKAESKETANAAGIKITETEAEAAILEAEAKAVPPLAGRSPSPIADEKGVLEWARKEALIAAKKQTGKDNIQTGEVIKPGGWFTEAKAAPTLAGRSPSPITDEKEVLEWARKEALIAAKKPTGQDNIQTGAVAKLGGWFTEANYFAAASYRQGAALASATKAPTMNFLK